MTTKADDPVVRMWKQQMDVALRLAEVMTEEAKKIRELQLAAAVEAHKSAEAARQLFQTATDAQEMWRMQNEWLSASLQRSLAYWRGMYEAAAQAQFGMTRFLSGPVEGILPQAPMPSIAPETRKAA